WLTVNLVCRRWRDIACSYPVFWRSIDVGRSLDWLELCLVRSDGVPLDIVIRESLTLFNVTMSLTKHAHRIRTLLITNTAARALPALSALFSHGMHGLE
ncbi:hypothetical protein C8Q76DRAFT_586722, partial [Earliella scabrosa]